MSLKHGILGFLHYRSMTGYDLNKVFSESIKFFWHAQTSQIYRELDKLQKTEMVDYKLIIQDGKPNKKEYRITQKGEDELSDWILRKDGKALEDFKSEFLMKVFFADTLTPQESIALIKKYKQDCIEYAQSLTKTRETIDTYGQEIGNNMAPLYWELTADYGKRYIMMCIEWADEAVRKIEKGQEMEENFTTKR